LREYINALIIGLIQGLTEFLPVSSSGHLVLSQHLLGVEMPGVTFEVFLHFGTLISVFWVFRRRLLEIIKGFLALFRKEEWARFKSSDDRWFGLLLILGSIPTAVIAFLLQDYVKQAFDSTLFVGIALLITGLLLWVADILPGGKKDIGQTTVLDALIIGAFQGLAIFPGISRSGSTISGSLYRNLDKKTAAEYSFLLSVPAVLGATLLEVFDLLRNNQIETDWFFYLVGVVAAAAAGILAIRFFINLLVKNKLRYFSIYCWLVGILVIILL
jgi:undecaprenyl-diphosphatase